MDNSIFSGGIPALMTPCHPDRTPNLPALVKKGKQLIAAGMNAVVYCGSMGDWPLLTDAQRQEGVAQLTSAGVPVIVGTGAQNSAQSNRGPRKRSESLSTPRRKPPAKRGVPNRRDRQRNRPEFFVCSGRIAFAFALNPKSQSNQHSED